MDLNQGLVSVGTQCGMNMMCTVKHVVQQMPVAPATATADTAAAAAAAVTI